MAGILLVHTFRKEHQWGVCVCGEILRVFCLSSGSFLPPPHPNPPTVAPPGPQKAAFGEAHCAHYACRPMCSSKILRNNLDDAVLGSSHQVCFAVYRAGVA